MKLQDLKSSYVKKLASTQICERGLKYFEDGFVHGLIYNGSSDQIEAKVEGRCECLYMVRIKSTKSHVDSLCSCQYEGNPCKHIVAVLLIFIRDKHKYAKNYEKEFASLDSLKSKLAQLSQAEILDILMSNANTNDKLRRSLLLKFEPKSEHVMASLAKDIESACTAFEVGHGTTMELVMKLEPIIESLKTLEIATKIKIIWLIADKLLGVLNEYGISDDEDLECTTIDQLEAIADLLKQESSHPDKSVILRKLAIHYVRYNCGITEYISDAIHQICTNKSDCEMLIGEIKKFTSADFDGEIYSKELSSDLVESLSELMDDFSK